jgi:pyrroloquinoline quinone biosynthesis protein B
LGQGLSVEALPIPHRAELSDMHAFVFRGPNRSLLFLPDHDRWEDTLAACGKPSLRAWLADLAVDVALLDGTFWSADELDGRSQQEVPHPPVQETLERLGKRREADPDIVFVHLNHTNPLHDEASLEHQTVTSLGWRVGQQGMSFTL